MGFNTTAQTQRSGEDCRGARAARVRALLALLATGLLVWAMPLVGLALAGRSVTPYLDFPPLTQAGSHAAFSWLLFVATALPAVAGFSLLAMAIAGSARAAVASPVRGRLPWWGQLGIVTMAVGWLLAWTEGLLPSELRRHTFTVIWLGYILGMNAIALRRGGECPLIHRRRWFFALFPVSAAFWWLFEYLNQFTDNWHYVGIGMPGRGAYIAQGSLAFATVLPAIATTRAWLATYIEFRPMRPVSSAPATAWFALAAGAAALFGIGLWPETLHPALWVGPLTIASALQFLLLRTSSFAPLAHGDWRPVLEPAAAALLCGLLWEMWNYGSLAKWQYSIPFVQRFHVFEMPLLGYAGYLPFGVLCAVVSDLVQKLVRPREPD